MKSQESATPYSKEAYERAQAEYERIRTAIGGDKTDEELMALIEARGELRASLDGLYANAWEEALAEHASRLRSEDDARAFLKLERKDQLKELLRRQLEGGMDRISDGGYTSELPGVHGITLGHPKLSGPRQSDAPLYLYAHFNCRDAKSGKDFGFTLTVRDDGIVSGEFPKNVPFTRQDASEELVRLFDDIGDSFFDEVDEEILPSGYFPGKRGGGGGGKEGPGKERYTDRRRIRFFKALPGALFGFRPVHGSWNGYRGVAFPDKIVLDSNQVGHAVYIFMNDEVYSFPPERLALPPSLRLPSKDERDRYRAQFWAPRASMTKFESLLAGAERVIHPDRDLVDEQWEKRMREDLTPYFPEWNAAEAA